MYLRAEQLRRAAEFLRDEPALAFRYLADVTAVDFYPNEPRFEVVYHLLSFPNNERLRLKVRTAGGESECRLPGSRVSVRQCIRARSLRSVWDSVRGTSLFEADPHAGRLGRPPAAQGLSHRGISLDAHNAGENSGPGRTGHPEHGAATPLDPRGIAPGARTRRARRCSTPCMTSATCTRASRNPSRARPTRKASRSPTGWITLPRSPTTWAFAWRSRRLLDIEIPPRAQWIRVLLTELTRIQSHLVWLGTPRHRPGGHVGPSLLLPGARSRSSTFSKWCPASA